MPLPDSSVSVASRAVRDFLKGGLRDADGSSVDVLVGSPADAQPRQNDRNHRLNLFMYRLEPSGYGSWPSPDEVWRLRMHCLVTAFAVDEGNVAPGENDLRILGEVVRLFHERPILDPIQVNGETVRLEIVPEAMGVDEINHLWATQGSEVPYRPSVAYEVSLVPVVPSERATGSPVTGALGLGVDARPRPGRGPPPGIRFPDAQRRRVDAADPAWAPAICFVVGETAAESLSFVDGSPELAAFTPRVWIAGEPGAEVTLHWEGWDRVRGWRAVGDVATAQASTPGIVPEAAADAATVELELPDEPRPGQLLLHARRTFVLPGEERDRQVRSNPLLVSVSDAGP